MSRILSKAIRWLRSLFQKKVKPPTADAYHQVRHLLAVGTYCGMSIRRRNGRDDRDEWVVKVSDFADACIFFSRMAKLLEKEDLHLHLKRGRTWRATIKPYTEGGSEPITIYFNRKTV